MYPTIKTPTCQTLSQNLHTPISHPTQRRCPSPHLHHRKLNLSPSHPAQRRWLPQETQPFLPAIQRSDDGSSLTFRPQETQPFLPAIQRSADGTPPPGSPQENSPSHSQKTERTDCQPSHKKRAPGPNTQELSQNSNIQLSSIVISHHPTRSRNF